jgi:hypothetical protein
MLPSWNLAAGLHSSFGFSMALPDPPAEGEEIDYISLTATEYDVAYGILRLNAATYFGGF